MQPLSKAEKALTGTKSLKFLPGSIRLKSSGQSTPRRLIDQITPSSSIGSLRSYRLDETTGMYINRLYAIELLNHSIISDGNSTNDTSKPSLKRIKKRPAVIADINDDSLKEKTATTNVILEGNKDHLETKKQIESLRKEYGDGWLHSRGAIMVHDVLGMENERIAKSTSCEQMIQSMLEETVAALPKKVLYATSTPNKVSQEENLSDVPISNEVSKTHQM